LPLVIKHILRCGTAAADECGFALIPMTLSPIKLVNTLMKPDPVTGKCDLILLLEHRFAHHEETVVRLLVHFIGSLLEAAENNIIESADLKDAAAKGEEIIREIFNSDKMDDLLNVRKVLLPDLHLSNSATTPEKEDSVSFSAMCFKDDGILSYCIDKTVVCVFEKPQVAGLTDNIYTYSWRTINFGNIQPFLTNILVQNSFNLRSCPFAIQMLQLLGRVTFLSLVGYISSTQYGRWYGQDYFIEPKIIFSNQEKLLVFLLLTHILHDIGTFIDHGKSVYHFFRNEWNLLDIMEYALSVVWFICKFKPKWFSIGRVCLAVTAIPQAMGLLRYLSFIKSLGELVIFVKAMLSEIAIFGGLYLLVLLGFGITFHGLYYNTDSFSSSTVTLETFFSFTLAQFDYNIFYTNSHLMNQFVFSLYRNGHYFN
jgi:hypothetical protein